MEIKFNKNAEQNSLVIFVSKDLNLDFINEINIDKERLISALKLKKFTGKFNDKASITLAVDSQIKQIILIGLGEVSELNNYKLCVLGASIISAMKANKIEAASVVIDKINGLLNLKAELAFGAYLKNYSFNKYKSSQKLNDFFAVEEINFIGDDYQQNEVEFKNNFKPIAESVHFSRDLVSEPANIIYPESFAERSKEELEKFDIKVEVLNEQDMKKLGMNALLGVGQGSARESQLMVIQYMGGKKDDAPIAFVGKGVTFDSGGISLKPSEHMEEMKYDMAGAAAVTGAMRALAARKAKVNAIAVVGLVENMPDGGAQRPSDVVKSMSGQTIEVINTDAEGRLVLADALWYTQNRFKPKFMIDLATLTGAIVVALSNQYAGLFSNDKQLADDLYDSGLATGEKLWQLPLSEDYDKMIDSQIADVRNTSTGKGGGSITAAQFLKRFVNETKWAHLDIAGMAWSHKDADLNPIGATGFGVRLLNYLAEKYEQK